MKRRIAQITIALAAVITLSACIVINSTDSAGYAPQAAPAHAD